MLSRNIWLFIVFKALPSFFFYSAGYFDFDSGTADEEQTRNGISQHGQKILTPWWMENKLQNAIYV